MMKRTMSNRHQELHFDIVNAEILLFTSLGIFVDKERPVSSSELISASSGIKTSANFVCA